MAPVNYSFNTDISPGQEISFDTPDNPQLPDEVAKDRAARAAWGLGNKMNYDDIWNGIKNGEEDTVRHRAAIAVDVDNQSSLSTVLNTYGVADPHLLYQNFRKQPTGSVFEDQYAKEFMSKFFVDHTDDDSTFNQIAREDPEGVSQNIAIGKEQLAWNQLVRNRKLDAEAALKAQSKLGYAGDFLKGFIPGYSTIKTQQVAPGFPTLTGFQKQAELEAYNGMPYPERVARFNMTMDKLIQDNPSLAVEYAGFLDDPNTKQVLLDNIFSSLDVMNIGQAAEMGVNAVRLLKMRRELARMVEQATKGSNAPGGFENVAAHATGDNVTAGITKVSSELASQLRGTAELNQQNIERDITSVYKGDADALTAGGPGNLGAEPANRIREFIMENLGSVLNALKNTNRVLRLGDALANREVLFKAYELIKNNFPGKDNNVLNVMPINHDIVTNTYSADVIFGRGDGSFFGSAREALVWAEKNGITITNVNGRSVHQRVVNAGVGSVEGLLDPVAKSNLDTLKKQVLDRANELYAKGDPSYIDVLKDVAKYDLEASKGVYSQGRGYYIAYNVPLREAEDFIREAVIKTSKATNKNDGFLNRWYGGWLRGAGEVLSEAEQESRKLSSYGPAIFKQMVVDATKPAVEAKARLRGKNWYEVVKNFGKGSEFDQALNLLQGRQKDLKSISELEDFWLDKFGHRPDEVQIAGYFAIKQAEAMNYVFTNIALYRNMRRLGGEQHVFSKTDSAGNVLKSPSVVGIVQHEMPDSDQYVAIQQGTNNWKVIKVNNHMRSDEGKIHAEMVKSGQKRMIRFYNPELNQFSDWIGSDKRIGYVLTDSVETGSLNLFQIPRKEAGHLEYRNNFYLKQADMRRDIDEGYTTHYYNGDKTAMGVDSRASGQELADAFNKIREFIRDGNTDAAKLVARDIDLPWPYIASKFAGKDKVWDLNEPFHVVPKGKTIADIPNHFDSLNVKGKSEFRDVSKGYSLARQFQVEFTGERDAYDVMAMHREGTASNPVYNYTKAELVDPWVSINRANTRMVNSLFMDDVKIQSVESWIQRYKDFLKASPEEFRDNPYRVFATDELKSGTPDNIKSKINAERYAIKAFAAVPSKLDNAIRAIEEGLSDSIYNSRNPFSKKINQLSRWTFKTTVAAPDFIRFATTHMAIGLFSPVQFAVQNMTYVTIWGLTGTKLAGQGTAAALMHQWSRLPFINDEVLKALDSKMTALGWRPGEWMEARKELSKTGFEFVSKETNMTLNQGHVYPNKIATTAWGNFLDMGEMFFKGGERNVRYGAWYTAFKEFRNAHPTGRLTLADRNTILARADLLAGEMTKANRSMLQAGPLSWSSQFLGYNLRLMELFTGKRLDWKTRARLLAVYAGAFGIPVTTGIATVVPASDWIKRKAIEYGYVEGENPIVDTLFHGMPSALAKQATGEGYNIGERYGPSNVFTDALQGDKSIWRIVTGAPGSMLFDAWMKSDPYYRAMGAALSGQGNPFKITVDDMIAPFKSIASVNNAVRFQQAINTGEWLSKNETTMAQGVSPWNAVFMSAFGLSPMSASNNTIFKNAGDVQKQLDEQTETNFVRDYVRGLRLLKNSPDPQGANVYFNNAFAELERNNYPKGKRDQLIARAEAALQGTLPAREMFHYYVGEDIPSNKIEERARQFGRQIQQGNYK